MEIKENEEKKSTNNNNNNNEKEAAAAASTSLNNNDDEKIDEIIKEEIKDTSLDDKTTTETSTVLDGGYGWIVLISSFLISFIIDGVMYSFGIILNEIKLDLNVRDELANLLSSFNTGLLFCSGPVVAGLANQFGYRIVVMGGAAITSLMFILTTFSPNIYIMIVTYGIIGGLSTGATYLSSLMIIPEYFDKKKGIANSIAMCGSGFGSFAIPPLVGWLIKQRDWQFAMSICACLIFQTCVCGAFLRPAKRKETKSKKSKNKEKRSLEDRRETIEAFTGSLMSVASGFSEKKQSAKEIIVGIIREITNFKLLCQNVGFLLITLSNFFIFTGYFAPFLYITKIAQDNGFSKEKASLLISIIGIVNIPARLFFGFISDRKILSAINLNTLSIILATIFLFLFIILQTAYWSLILFSVLFAIGIAGINSLTTPYLVELIGKEKFANATGIVSLFRGFGCFVGPFLAGAIAKQFGEVNSFFFSGICYFIGLILSLLVSLYSLIQRCCMKKNKKGKKKNTDSVDENDKKDSELNKELLTPV